MVPSPEPLSFGWQVFGLRDFRQDLWDHGYVARPEDWAEGFIVLKPIRLLGNTSAGEEAIASWLGRPGTGWNPSRLTKVEFGGLSDSEDLAECYRARGFMDVRVARELVWENDGKEVTLVYHIHEGPRYRARKGVVLAAWEGYALLTPASLLIPDSALGSGDIDGRPSSAPLPLPVPGGAPLSEYSQEVIENDLARLQAVAALEGYDVSATPVRRAEAGVVTILYSVSFSFTSRCNPPMGGFFR
jgi:hypothetical protein